MKSPVVSVIMPVYNAEKYIKDTIGSVLHQSFPDFELILVDDCGTDGTMGIVNKISDSRLRILHNDRNRGIAYSRNRALKESRGKYVAILDDDDIAIQDRLEKQVCFLEEHACMDVVGGRSEWIDENGKLIKEAEEVVEDPEWIKAYFLFYNIFHNSEIMLRTSFIRENDLKYQDNMLGMEDFRFWVQCSKCGNMTNIQDVVLKKRQIPTNETSRIKAGYYEERSEKYMEIQKESLLKSGFELTDKEFGQLLSMMREDILIPCTGWPQVCEIYHILKKMVYQAEKKRMSFAKVIESWFHMILIEIVKNMDDQDVWAD